MPSFKITLTEPSYEGWIAISTGWFKSKVNFSVSKSSKAPLGSFPSSLSPAVFILNVLNGLYSYTKLPF